MLIIVLLVLSPVKSQKIETGMYNLIMTVDYFSIVGNPDGDVPNDDGDLEFELKYIISDYSIFNDTFGMITVINKNGIEDQTPKSNVNQTILFDTKPNRTSLINQSFDYIQYLEVKRDRANFEISFELTETTINNKGEDENTPWNTNKAIIPFSNESIDVIWEDPYPVVISIHLEYTLSEIIFDATMGVYEKYKNYIFIGVVIIIIVLLVTISISIKRRKNWNIISF